MFFVEGILRQGLMKIETLKLPNALLKLKNKIQLYYFD